MPVVTPTDFTNSTGISVTGDDLSSVAAMSAAVCDALKRKCFPYALEDTTLTLFACDAPTTNVLFLPLKPCRSLTALYLAWDANGDPSKATADTLLTPYTDYYMPVDPLTGWSMTGQVLRRSRGIWGYEYRYSLGKLAATVGSNVGAVFVSGSFGPTSVNEAVREAAVRAVNLLYQRRKTGTPLQSENWGGYSYSNTSAFTAEAAVNSPEVVELLRSAGVLPYHIG